jgi:hypothetical protein
MKRTIATVGLALAAATTLLPATAAHADPLDIIHTLMPTCPPPTKPVAYVWVSGHEMLVCAYLTPIADGSL